mmetsp:Transcript_12570/g.18481  ORF Transcript_12570/g.18481 Transcript_12570/m.18481 type:complete len:1027 (+) Transcript_12570:193-3273(+)|eukprot:CAMPEP_0194219976 /NCGR_PEP_ID=MMETSP0156-20130528/27229_1 /TAXON_ID=33649 /ORGANISM="Thalassionema nitzschioides, Strain L26-B" /LENGTH=1026 /DNA_ID=CAMNT_0038949827 /DNA_START=113 /DNA_END=3193 /DNA_ORIENTATION=-
MRESQTECKESIVATIGGYTEISDSAQTNNVKVSHLYMHMTLQAKKATPPLTKIPRRKKKVGGNEEKRLSPISSFQKSRAPLAPIMEIVDYRPLPQQTVINPRQDVTSFWKVVSTGAVIGGIGGLLLALGFILIHRLQIVSNNPFQISWNHHNEKRQLASFSLTRPSPKLVIAGKVSVADASCNIAQLNLATDEWSLDERIQLSLYNSYSGGEVYSLLANHTSEPMQSKSAGSGELIVVGAFDTTYRNNQVTYCSVGKWNGFILSKVGEGLCNVALSKGMKITTAALAGPKDVYVAGSFHTQVWNGDRHEFVKIFNIAHFNAVEQVWLPLQIGQVTCSWCTVTVLALAWDSKRNQLHIAGKFDAIDGRNVPAGLAIYNKESGHLVAHPGGGLSMTNVTQDGVATALQLDERAGVLYVMGSFERLTKTNEICHGLAAYEINADRWTCLADGAHSVVPTGGGNMLLTPYGLMVAGKTKQKTTTWPNSSHPYTVALLKTTLKKHNNNYRNDNDDYIYNSTDPIHDFNWSWLPGFPGHNEPLHALANGFGDYDGTVFIGGDNFVVKWFYQKSGTSTSSSSSKPKRVPVTKDLSRGNVRGAIMTISQMMPASDESKDPDSPTNSATLKIIIFGVAFGTIIGMVMAILFNRKVSSKLVSIFARDAQLKGISLDTLTYSALEHTSITEAYEKAMKTRHVQHPHLLTLIDPQEIFLQRIIGEGTFGRVWSARWRSAKVAVKEFVFAQAAVAGKSAMQEEIIQEIIGEAGMMAILRHPNVLQLFGCSLTAQAIWIVSELCSLGSLRQLLDDHEKILPLGLRVSMALQVAEGMAYLHNQDPPIIHRDLKSHNIFVHETFTACDSERESDQGILRNEDASPNMMFRFKVEVDKLETESTILAKIGDWGSARATLSGSRTMTHGVGTACWLAPEVIKHARSSKFSDVYSYGIVLWELATREEVYQGLETTQIIAKVANESLRPPVPHDCPWKHIMVKCWEENPLDRLEFDEIVEMFNEVVARLPADQMAQMSYHTSDS